MIQNVAKKRGTQAGSQEALALMSLLQYMDAANAGRPEMQLDLRARRVVQALGLEGDQPLVAVAQRLGVSATTMTGLADRLEGQGFVRRSPHPSDRRALVLQLTEAGTKLFKDETAFYQRLIDRALGPLDHDSRQQLLSALRQLPLAAAAPETARSESGVARRA